MSESAPVVQTEGLEGLLAQVEALRRKGAGTADVARRPDPVRLHFIEALARRLQAAPPSVRAVLQIKLVEALKAADDAVETGPLLLQTTMPAETAAREAPPVRLEHAEGSTEKPAPRKHRTKTPLEAAAPAAPMSLLGQLIRHIESASSNPDLSAGGNAPKPTASTRPPDLKSAVRFRETWARISAETEVDQARHRAPENAGPLNAHNLVLRTLGLMRELSPDYLRRFMSHTESLMWLDQAVGQLKQPAGKTKWAKAGKAKK